MSRANARVGTGASPVQADRSSAPPAFTSDDEGMSIAENIAQVRERIAAAPGAPVEMLVQR